jgi:prevent-host-death family protein
MKLVTVREFRNRSGVLLDELKETGEIVLTSNGRPVAVITAVAGDDLEEQLKALRRGRALAALDRIRATARARGLDTLTMDDVDKEITETRRELGASARGSAGRKRK